MKKIIKNLKKELGAIDKVLVTLLLIIFALVGLIGLENWSNSQRDSLIEESDNAIEKVMDENLNK